MQITRQQFPGFQRQSKLDVVTYSLTNFGRVHTYTYSVAYVGYKRYKLSVTQCMIRPILEKVETFSAVRYGQHRALMVPDASKVTQ